MASYFEQDSKITVSIHHVHREATFRSNLTFLQDFEVMVNRYKLQTDPKIDRNMIIDGPLQDIIV